ncbi:Uu.00g141530.m01.CDS01 [Anthostomella pinea]|uniref:Uu.00g141530.m01.CDS01 n=1 Tax=Anthostomella pinea TaxID=933095 RepID=A0AAI8VQB3_9PEZI|nr:Uu.00g141530.m01.CDS01 [Anthostomella pinea]
MLRVLDNIYSRGICHGAFRPSNILHKQTGIDTLPKAQMQQLLGEPEQGFVKTIAKDDPGSMAPRYAGRSVCTSALEPFIVPENIADIDFGVAFDISCPPMTTGIPMAYAAPELLFYGRPSNKSDVWSLGCTMLELLRSERFGSDIDREACLLHQAWKWEEYRGFTISCHKRWFWFFWTTNGFGVMALPEHLSHSL